jgi:hypothetical protein
MAFVGCFKDPVALVPNGLTDETYEISGGVGYTEASLTGDCNIEDVQMHPVVIDNDLIDRFNIIKWSKISEINNIDLVSRFSNIASRNHHFNHNGNMINIDNLINRVSDDGGLVSFVFQGDPYDVNSWGTMYLLDNCEKLYGISNAVR